MVVYLVEVQPRSREAALNKAGTVLDLVRRCQMTWTRWAKLATAMLAKHATLR